MQIDDRIRAEMIRQQREELEKKREVMQNVARRRIYFGFFDGYKQGQGDLIRCALLGLYDEGDTRLAGVAEELQAEYVWWCLGHNLAVAGGLSRAFRLGLPARTKVLDLQYGGMRLYGEEFGYEMIHSHAWVAGCGKEAP